MAVCYGSRHIFGDWLGLGAKISKTKKLGKPAWPAWVRPLAAFATPARGRQYPVGGDASIAMVCTVGLGMSQLGTRVTIVPRY